MLLNARQIIQVNVFTFLLYQILKGDENMNILESYYSMRVNKMFYSKVPIELIKQPKRRKEKSRFNEFWKVKYLQTLEAEKCRVVINNHEYLITAKEGVLAEINKELINNE